MSDHAWASAPRRPASRFRTPTALPPALKALSETDEWVDAVGRPGHAKIGPNIDLGIAVWLVEKSCSDGDDTARWVFIAEQGCDFDVCGKV
jgi:hypothetical protein